MRNAIKPLTMLFSLLLSLTMMTGCGQKGPLFLPGDPSSIQTDVPGQNQDDQSEDDSDDEDDE